MVKIAYLPLTLEEFLELPETKPPREYINGKITQKPMPKTRHSRLQGKLTSTINSVVEEGQIAYAFPDIRCTFCGRSIVSDLAVIRWKQIEFDDEGEPVDDVFIAPDWTIEIISPGQSSNRVTGNILHCLRHGSQLGWLIDPYDRSVLVFIPNQQPELCQVSDSLVVLDGIDLQLTAEEIFGWLNKIATHSPTWPLATLRERSGGG
ncbi:MAG: Uma2 family endonuclease [Moorea sp. SIO2I5]|nr:Uma2 family endonuclease [Moorena sp. SIO2I5]